MSSNGTRSLEAWLVLAGMLAAMAWYARPQIGLSLAPLAKLLQMLAVGSGG